MLTRIPVAELRLGMYIHKMGGSWLNHPFVRGSFLLTDALDLQRIHEAQVVDVWIDPDKGAGARPHSEVDRLAAQLETTPDAVVERRGYGTGTGTGNLAAEVENARRLCAKARGQVMAMFEDARLGKAVEPATTLPLVSEIDAAVQRNAAAVLSVARLKCHDDYTYLHSVAVCALMLSLARQLGLDKDQTMLCGVAGLMHDLGKAFVSQEILSKPGKLTSDEFATMKLHSVDGAQLLRRSKAAPEVVDVALHHHEKVNGQGYPHGLMGEEISLLARMGAVCDVYDAVTSVRSYKKPWDPAMAMREMARWDGHFDKSIFKAFVQSVGIYPIGSLVRLASQRLAVVVEPGTTSLLSPKVKAFFSLRSNEPIATRVIDLAERGCTDQIVGPEDPAAWGFSHLDKLWP